MQQVPRRRPKKRRLEPDEKPSHPTQLDDNVLGFEPSSGSDSDSDSDNDGDNDGAKDITAKEVCLDIDSEGKQRGSGGRVVTEKDSEVAIGSGSVCVEDVDVSSSEPRDEDLNAIAGGEKAADSCKECVGS